MAEENKKEEPKAAEEKPAAEKKAPAKKSSRRKKAPRSAVKPAPQKVAPPAPKKREPALPADTWVSVANVRLGKPAFVVAGALSQHLGSPAALTESQVREAIEKFLSQSL